MSYKKLVTYWIIIQNDLPSCTSIKGMYSYYEKKKSSKRNIFKESLQEEKYH